MERNDMHFSVDRCWNWTCGLQHGTSLCH